MVNIGEQDNMKGNILNLSTDLFCERCHHKLKDGGKYCNGCRREINRAFQKKHAIKRWARNNH